MRSKNMKKSKGPPGGPTTSTSVSPTKDASTSTATDATATAATQRTSATGSTSSSHQSIATHAQTLPMMSSLSALAVESESASESTAAETTNADEVDEDDEQEEEEARRRISQDAADESQRQLVASGVAVSQVLSTSGPPPTFGTGFCSHGAECIVPRVFTSSERAAHSLPAESFPGCTKHMCRCSPPAYSHTPCGNVALSKAAGRPLTADEGEALEAEFLCKRCVQLALPYARGGGPYLVAWVESRKAGAAPPPPPLIAPPAPRPLEPVEDAATQKLRLAAELKARNDLRDVTRASGDDVLCYLTSQPLHVLSVAERQAATKALRLSIDTVTRGVKLSHGTRLAIISAPEDPDHCRIVLIADAPGDGDCAIHSILRHELVASRRAAIAKANSSIAKEPLFPTYVRSDEAVKAYRLRIAAEVKALALAGGEFSELFYRAPEEPAGTVHFDHKGSPVLIADTAEYGGAVRAADLGNHMDSIVLTAASAANGVCYRLLRLSEIRGRWPLELGVDVLVPASADPWLRAPTVPSPPFATEQDLIGIHYLVQSRETLANGDIRGHWEPALILPRSGSGGGAGTYHIAVKIPSSRGGSTPTVGLSPSTSPASTPPTSPRHGPLQRRTTDLVASMDLNKEVTLRGEGEAEASRPESGDEGGSGPRPVVPITPRARQGQDRSTAADRETESSTNGKWVLAFEPLHRHGLGSRTTIGVPIPMAAFGPPTLTSYATTYEGRVGAVHYSRGRSGEEKKSIFVGDLIVKGEAIYVVEAIVVPRKGSTGAKWPTLVVYDLQGPPRDRALAAASRAAGTITSIPSDTIPAIGRAACEAGGPYRRSTIHLSSRFVGNLTRCQCFTEDEVEAAWASHGDKPLVVSEAGALITTADQAAKKAGALDLRESPQRRGMKTRTASGAKAKAKTKAQRRSTGDAATASRETSDGTSSSSSSDGDGDDTDDEDEEEEDDDVEEEAPSVEGARAGTKRGTKRKAATKTTKSKPAKSAPSELQQLANLIGTKIEAQSTELRADIMSTNTLVRKQGDILGQHSAALRAQAAEIQRMKLLSPHGAGQAATDLMAGVPPVLASAPPSGQLVDFAGLGGGYLGGVRGALSATDFAAVLRSCADNLDSRITFEGQVKQAIFGFNRSR